MEQCEICKIDGDTMRDRMDLRTDLEENLQNQDFCQLKTMENQTPFEPSIRRKAYSVSELADLYEVSNKTINNWLRPFKYDIGQKVGRLYTVRQVNIIFEKLGEPVLAMEA